MTDNFYAPPHSIEAEQAVIGGLLLDDDSSERVQKVLAMLKPDSFYSRPHKIIFEEITRMHREQKPVDGLTLFDELERKSLTTSVGGFAYIAEIAKNTPSAANIVAYAMQVRETAMERYAINRMTEATELLYSRNGMTATQKYEAIQSIFTQLTDHAKTGSRRGLRSFGEVMEDWVSDLEKRFDPSGEQRGMSTGIPSLDRMLSPKGLVKGSLFVIGARPKMGKTTLYSQMAINCAVHEKKPALMFSLEMPGDQILEKLVGQKSGVNPNIFYLPATNDADDGYQGDYDGDFNRAIETANRLSEIDLLYIDDTPGLSLAQIVSESRRIKREKGCVGMILVDYRRTFAATLETILPENPSRARPNAGSWSAGRKGKFFFRYPFIASARSGAGLYLARPVTIAYLNTSPHLLLALLALSIAPRSSNRRITSSICIGSIS